MTACFQLASGRKYNVRATALAQQGGRHNNVVCNVLLLDGTVQAFKVNKQNKGQLLLDLVFDHLELTERDYFGLQLADTQGWVDPTKAIKKQLRRGSPHSLNFRIRFFVTDPSKLQEEYTRYQYFLQIKQDICSGRLPCARSAAALLASYAVQSELGDHSDSEHLPGYLCDHRFIPDAPRDFEKEVVKHHRRHAGLSPAQSEFLYLNTARTLELYGVELHHARDQSNTEIYIGVMSSGLVIYKNRLQINFFPWVKIVKISFKCRHFFIQLRKERHESRETLLGFNMASYRPSKNLWKACVEHHTFFRLERPSMPQKNLMAHYLTLGSKYRYRGRTEVQSVRYGKEMAVKGRLFPRSPSKPLLRRLSSDVYLESASGTSSTEERPETRSLPPGSPPASPRHSYTVCAQEGGRLRPRPIGHLPDHVTRNSASSLPCQASENHKASPSSSWTQVNGTSLGSTPSPNSPASGNQDPLLPSKQSRTSWSSYINHGPAATDSPTVNGGAPHDNAVLIKMSPDKLGRLGFNVEGGSDRKMPAHVSGVDPGSTADQCAPRLHGGDQVAAVDGEDVSGLTRDQGAAVVVEASCEERSGELVLLVRPNSLYEAEDDKALDRRRTFQAAPEQTAPDQEAGRPDPDACRSSLQQLKETLASGALLAQFEQLYRKKPGLTASCARLPQNVSKNRYRDISPYDATRVVLKGENDYINANYINIPASGSVNRYIACQGPLPATCGDFWQMTWEQSCSLLVVLTTQVERGRVKCHQYWPNLAGSATYGGFQVACVTQEGSSAFVAREMTVTHLESQESRTLTQLQYLAWPDHGVPEDSSDFLELVGLVRCRRRGGEGRPVVVHCSAGIGRTGVLITMETALCLLEGGQPVYPLDIVRTMREQRAMMIQTPSQYRFVCEAVLKVYENGLVEPAAPPQSQKTNGFKP
ncbi:tyrosine-protein phosphatase non-receptor type 4-like [Polymixia lowei]